MWDVKVREFVHDDIIDTPQWQFDQIDIAVDPAARCSAAPSPLSTPLAVLAR